jgi:hypothetical protein
MSCSVECPDEPAEPIRSLLAERRGQESWCRIVGIITDTRRRPQELNARLREISNRGLSSVNTG